MAKLARLMPPDLPLAIQPARLAASGECLTGRLGFTDMPRISELVRNHQGTVSYRLVFSRDDKGIINITGNLSAGLLVLCQRCLNEMELIIDNPVNIGLVGSQEEAKDLPDQLEPFITEGREISLVRLIEEELLLGLPLSPLHSPAVCPATQVLKEYTPVKTNPFAVLKNVKTGKK
jgi:uncharacterized protein